MNMKESNGNADDGIIRQQTICLANDYMKLLIKEKNFEEWIKLWHEDGVCEFPFAADKAKSVLVGRQEIANYMVNFPKYFEIETMEDLIVYPMLDPQVLVAELSIKAKALATNVSYNQKYVSIFQVKEGKLFHYKEFWNPLITMKAFGKPGFMNVEA